MFKAGSGTLIKNNQDYGHEAAIASSLLLTASSIRRFKKGPVPAGLTILGLTSLSYYIYKFEQFRNGV